MQCEKQVGNYIFKLIEVVWVDTCGDDPRAENAKNEYDNYIVRADNIDLNMLTSDEYLCALSAYGYKDTDDFTASYGEKSLDNLLPLVAEMVFENEPYGSYPISEVVSWADAEKIIQKYIDEN